MGNLLFYYIDILFCTIGGLIICGLVASIFERVFVHLVGKTFGYKAIMMTAVIGTPVHEAGHALMCLIFGHRIEEIKLYEPDTSTGTLGYVSHSYNPKNIYQNCGNLFIGLGPIFSGLGLITVIMFTCFSNSINVFLSNSFSLIQNNGSIVDILLEVIKMPWQMITEEGNIILKILGLVVIASIIMHINLSPADIKGSVAGLSVYAIIAGIFAFVTSFFDKNVVLSIQSGLHIFSMYCFVLFTIIYIFAILIIVIAAIPYLIKKSGRKK